nr:hypothetical protein [Methylomarinum sp. Ch1-1]MDP4520499.1 hypothetical protein [Methylomarinum sp. Ch1-1]
MSEISKHDTPVTVRLTEESTGSASAASDRLQAEDWLMMSEFGSDQQEMDWLMAQLMADDADALPAPHASVAELGAKAVGPASELTEQWLAMVEQGAEQEELELMAAQLMIDESDVDDLQATQQVQKALIAEGEKLTDSVNDEADKGSISTDKHEPRSRVVSAELDEVVEASAPACIEIGPFANDPQMTAWLNKQGLDPQRTETFVKEQQAISSYLVYYPAAETFAASRNNVALLEKRGIKDLWLFRKGEMKGAISLGLFKQKYRAEKFAKRMISKGIAADVSARYTTEKRLYLRVNQPFSTVQAEDLDLSNLRIGETKDKRKVSSYLVYYPAAETFAASRNNVSMLRNKGIKELWLFRKGEMKGAISLGLFTEKQRADNIVERLAGKGIKVNVAERYDDEEERSAEQAEVLTINKCVTED